MESLHQTTPEIEARHWAPSSSTQTGERQIYADVVKPVADRVGGLILLVLAAPILLLTVLALMATIGSPVVYRQVRIGWRGDEFELLKLRTMIHDRRESNDDFSGPDRRQAHKTPDDPRVVPIGKILRKLRLDELPQLWNVVRGDMSLVGPRPELPAIVNQYEPWQHRRHDVKPGLTGLWQVSAPENVLMHECTEIDLDYIETISLGSDLKIILQTPGAMLGRRGY